MSLRLTFILIIICLFVIGGWFFNNLTSLEINNTILNVEIADTNEERQKGLSGRKELTNTQGMLFIFSQPGFYSFWMKEMLFPLDIIWINSDKKVVFIKEDAQPCLEENCQTIQSDEEAQYVLELKAGMVEELNIKIGDKLIFDI